MANRRLKVIVLFSCVVVHLRPGSRRDAAHTSLTIRKPSSRRTGSRRCAARGHELGEADAREIIRRKLPS